MPNIEYIPYKNRDASGEVSYIPVAQRDREMVEYIPLAMRGDDGSKEKKSLQK